MENVVFAPKPLETYQIIDWQIEIHESRSKKDKKLGKITYIYQPKEYENIYKRFQVYMWLCFSDYYDGFAVTIARQKWKQISNDPFPQTVDEFMEAEFLEPYQVVVDMNGKYPDLKEVITYDYVVGEIEDDEIPF